MISNPDRASRGGDVPGQTKTDINGAVGSALDVADASFDPGYDLEDSLCDMTPGFVSVADLKRGYASYGVSVGDKRGKGFI